MRKRLEGRHSADKTVREGIVEMHDHDRDCGSYAFHLLEKSVAGYHDLGSRRSLCFPVDRFHKVHTVIVMIPEYELDPSTILLAHPEQNAFT